MNSFFPFTLVFVQQLCPIIRYSLLSPVVRNNSSVISLPNVISFFFVWGLESTQPLGAVKKTNTLEWHVSDKGAQLHIYNYAPMQTFLQKHAEQRFMHAQQRQAHVQTIKKKKSCRCRWTITESATWTKSLDQIVEGIPVNGETSAKELQDCRRHKDTVSASDI